MKIVVGVAALVVWACLTGSADIAYDAELN